MAGSPRREASSPPQRPFRALSGQPPDRRRTVGESALTGKVWAPFRGARSCYVKASSPIVRCLSGGGHKRL
eukprot:12673498-Alexandrium_andersonii.AAC.1